MITVGRLKELLAELPDQTFVYGYEGFEDTGISFELQDESWFIRARGPEYGEELDTFIEGFQQQAMG